MKRSLLLFGLVGIGFVCVTGLPDRTSLAALPNQSAANNTAIDKLEDRIAKLEAVVRSLQNTVAGIQSQTPDKSKLLDGTILTGTWVSDTKSQVITLKFDAEQRFEIVANTPNGAEHGFGTWKFGEKNQVIASYRYDRTGSLNTELTLTYNSVDLLEFSGVLYRRQQLKPVTHN